MPIQIIITSDSALEAHEEIAALAGLIQARNVAAPNRKTAGVTPAEIEAGRDAEAGLRWLERQKSALTAEPETPKRKRRTKAEIAADEAAEAAANISATPENRVDPAEAEIPEDGADVLFPEEEAEVEQGDFFDEEDDLIDGYPATEDGLRDAMKAYVAKFDMAAAQKNAKTLFGGYAKVSEVAAAGDAVLAAAIANFANAVRTGKEV